MLPECPKCGRPFLVGWNKCPGCGMVTMWSRFDYEMKEPEPNDLRLAALSAWSSLLVVFYLTFNGSGIDAVRTPIALLASLGMASLFTAFLFRRSRKTGKRGYFYFMDWLIGIRERK